MGTTINNLAVVQNSTEELTDLIKANSLAYQVSGVQYSTSTAPLVFGIKKGSTLISFEIVQKTPEKTFRAITDPDGFTEELVDDVFAIFGKDAIEILKQIAANNLADTLDDVIITYMNNIATKVNNVVYNFTTTPDHREIIRNLILKINKERFVMADTLLRGLPQILIVSPSIAALFSNKINDSDSKAGTRENIKNVGKMDDMSVYCDFNAVSDYVTIAHKNHLPGDSSIILIPIRTPKAAIVNHEETGQPQIHFSHKYAYSRNPLDTGTGTNDSDFIYNFQVTLTDFNLI